MTADRLRRMLGDLSHLSPEDAELYVALYAERNLVSRGEAVRVRNDAAYSRWAERHPAWADELSTPGDSTVDDG